MISLSYPWEFGNLPCPVNTRNVQEWTATERLKASDAKVVQSIDELEVEVNAYNFPLTNINFVLADYKEIIRK